MKTERVVVITGAGGGIGSLLVERFLANGDSVVATDAVSDGLEALAARHDAEALTTAVCDITSEAEVEQLVEVVQKTAGRVDVLINCAGFFPFAMFEEMTFAQWQKVIDVNLTGVYLVTHNFLRLMKDNGWGRIINFSSGSVLAGAPGQAHYVAAKAGIIGLTRALARELGGYNITVNTITPGVTLTPAVADHFPPELLEAQRNRRALTRDQQADDLVGPVFFLAAPDSDFITGQILNVDGGNIMP